MHDRRHEGQTLVFGNQGALYMTNMTWWDHQTESIWVQMTGRAARGPLTGATLSQLPAYTGPWSTWVAEHPDTEVLIPVAGSIRFFHERPRNDFVVGVTLDGDAAAYYYGPLAERGLINDEVGGVPIVVYADVETRSIKAHARAIGGNVLTFELAEGKLRDLETGSVWNPLQNRASCSGRSRTRRPSTGAGRTSIRRADFFRLRSCRPHAVLCQWSGWWD